MTDGVLLAGAAFLAAVRRFRVTAAFRAADVPIGQLRRLHESSGLANALASATAAQDRTGRRRLQADLRRQRSGSLGEPHP